MKCPGRISIVPTGIIAPFAGAWIEIVTVTGTWQTWPIAPFAGAWIEMTITELIPVPIRIAPFAGAWIEIMRSARGSIQSVKSHPSRVRGLK